MRKYTCLILLVAFFFSIETYAFKKDHIYIVYLKNGNVVRGYILEDKPNIEIKFKTLDGSLIIYPYNDFNRLEEDKLNLPGKIKVARIKVVYDKETFLIGGISLHPSQMSGNLMGGIVKNYGVYLNLKTNFNFDGSYLSIGNSYANRYFNGNIYPGRFGVTGGALYRVSKPITLYGGLGYGNRWVNWETISGSKFRVSDITYTGLEYETGIIYNINKLFFTGGLSTIGLRYMELNLGIGIKI